jgi:tape measure domain-containing protein
MLVGEVFARMGLDSKQYEKGLDKLEGVTQKRAMTLGSIFKGAFSVALGIGVFEAVKMGFQTIASTAIGFNAQMEQARIGFTTMLGSAERAEAFLRDMADFAAKTPFEFPELLDASKRMLAYGFAAKDVLPTMEAVGNASAAVGLGTEGINRIILALGQMRAKGKVSAEEMRQLTETGIPAWEMLAEAMGFSADEAGKVMDMASKGLIPADRAIKMLVEGMNKSFPDMMKNMENTWEGVTSTIKDIWQMTIGAVTENLFQGLVSWLQGVRDFASEFYDTFQKYGLQRAIHESFGPEVAALVSVLGAVMRGLASAVKAVTGFFVQYGKQIKFVAIVMGTYLALTKAVTLAKQMMIAVTAVERGQLLAKIPVLNVVSTAMGIYRVQMALAAAQGIALTGVIAKLRVALYSLWSALGPVGWIILGLSAAVGVGTHLWGKYTQSVYSGAKIHEELAEGADQAGKSASDATGAIEDEADALTEAGKAANQNLQSFDEVHTLQENMSGSAGDLADSLGLGEIEAPGDIGGLEIPNIGTQLEEMKPTLAGFWEWIKQGFANTWGEVKTAINNAWNALKEWAQAHPIIAGIAAAITALFIPALIKAGVQAAVNGAKVVAAWALQAAEAVKSVATQVAQFVIVGARWAWLGVQATVNAGKTVLAWTMQGLEAVKSVATQVAQFVIAGARWAWLGVQATVNAGKTVLAWTMQGLEAVKSVATQVAQFVIAGARWAWLGVQATVNAGKTVLAWTMQGLEAVKSVATQVAQFVIAGARWAWLGVQAGISAAQVAAAWVLQRVQAIASVAVQVAQMVLIGAKWVWMGVTAMANAAVMAAAWFVALGPVAWVIATVAAVALAVALNWDWIKEKTQEVWEIVATWLSEKWEGIKSAAKTAWEWIKKYIIDPIQGAWTWLEKTWGEIAGFLERTWNGIKKTAGDIWENGIVGVIKGAVNSLIGAIEGGLNYVITGINSFIQKINDKIKQLNKVPGVNISTISPIGKIDIPRLAKGTNYVPQDMFAFLHEGEAVVPKKYNPDAAGLTAEAMEQAVYRAFINALRVIQTSSPQSSDDRELVLKIDNTVLARMQLPAIIREGQRQGLNLVVQPQGV